MLLIRGCVLVLFFMLFLVPWLGASGARAAGVADFLAACTGASNLDEEICACCAEKASQELSPAGFDLLVASLGEDAERVDALRPTVPPAEMVQVGMFMVNKPGECAKELAQ